MAGRSDPPHDLFDSRPPPHPPSSLQLSMSPAPLLALRQLVKNYGGVRALRGVDFDLQAGEVHALLGENGAGKSTLIKVITGAHQPNGGTLTLAGQRVAPSQRRSPVAERSHTGTQEAARSVTPKPRRLHGQYAQESPRTTDRPAVRRRRPAHRFPSRRRPTRKRFFRAVQSRSLWPNRSSMVRMEWTRCHALP